MKNLLLTLGHNSSAVLVEDGKVVCGYEMERLTRVKSDSRFPAPVFEDVIRAKPDMVYATHWAPDGMLNSMSAKHWDPRRFEGVPIRTLSPDFSHHDAHMHGAICYAGPRFPRRLGSIGVVVDGFGTLGEHFSVYSLSGNECRLLERVHGYDTSLGLWYQYATAFMGMKMHEDEYKLLGYEAHVDPIVARRLDAAAYRTSDEWLVNMKKSVYGSKYDPVYDVTALTHVKQRIFDHLTAIAGEFAVNDVSSFEGRVVMSYYVQKVLELVVLRKVAQYNPTSLLLSGGVFYNVKLNKLLVDITAPNVTCVYPLAGDQGCAIGLYAYDHPEFVFPDDLCWGRRELKDVGQVQNLWYADDEAEAAEIVSRMLTRVGYINLVRGAMEFGPRALCNTSTLALPSPENVQKINRANNRNTVMPMAPVVTSSQYREMFENWGCVWKSSMHMIVALEYAEHPLQDQMGIAHAYEYPYRHHTGRPQVVAHDDQLMNRLLNDYGPLINTSFNYHGSPIVMSMGAIINDHMKQFRNDPLFTTVVVKNA
jgi:predicted NodU family carbamoyl transferase